MYFRPLLLLSSACALLLTAAAQLRIPLGLDRHVPAPESNPLTAARVAAGRLLFFSKALSLDHTLSCTSCHDPRRSFADRNALAIGVGGQTADRHSPALLNRAWGKSFFWDGRAATLEQQVLQPILNPKEMALSLDELERRVQGDSTLAGALRQAFGEPPSSPRIAQALAAYVRTILSGDSAYDRFVAGDKTALREQAELGLRLFRGKANCVVCHLGPNLTDERFHNTGAGWSDGRWADTGRAGWSKDDVDRGAFKTPGLRNVSETAPYLHDGSLKTLDEVIDFYNDGGRANPNLDSEIVPLRLTPAEKLALRAFLESLTGVVQEGWRE